MILEVCKVTGGAGGRGVRTMPSGDGRWVHQKRFGRSVSKHKVLSDLLRTSEFFLLLRAENLKLSAQIPASQSSWLPYPIYCGSVLSGL